jgi:uncharacterized membrane protein YfcA
LPFDPAALLPPGLDPLHALALVGLSFVTSLITATFSLGGGVLMLAVLTLVFPPAVVVPVHGAVQVGSNIGRAVVQRLHIQWRYVLWISLGGLIGTALGGQIATLLPVLLFQTLIAVFILVSTWLPTPRFVGESRLAQFLGGLVLSALSMVVGAVGPLMAVFLKGLPDRRELVATHAALMTINHLMKVAAFTALGFAFSAYLPLVAAMLVFGFFGTVLGGRLLLKVPEKAFRLVFGLLLTLVALQLLWDALMGR